MYKYVHPTNRVNERNPSFVVGYAQGYPDTSFVSRLSVSGMEKNAHICSWFTSLVTFCLGFTHSGTQQCLCGELFFLHLGMKLD